jgi:quinolinate synthase
VHNYQLPEVQDIADFTGDSLGLSIEASKTSAETIVFCGVYFMAETAKILSPQKTVLIPDPSAGCPMADMITAEQVRDLKAQHPKAKVVCYVNTSAEVKAECDYCCTSANAVEMLQNAFDEKDEIIFIPDKHLASYAAFKAKRHVILWEGYCPSHARILPEHILNLKKEHPNAKVIVHPECSAAVVKIADAVLSTSGMLRYAKESSAKEFIFGTEVGMEYPLKMENPGKIFYPASAMALCPNMKKTTLDKVLHSLEAMVYEVKLSGDLIARAKKPIDNMIHFRKDAQLTKK